MADTWHNIHDILTDDKNWEHGYGGDCLKTSQCVEQIEALLALSNLPESTNISSELAECKEKLGKVQGNIPRTSLDRYGEIAYRTAYNPDYATPWDKLSTLTKRKYKAMAKAILTQAGADYVE